MYVACDGTVGGYPDPNFYFFVDRDPCKTFQGVAIQGIQKSDNIPVYLVFATFDFAACLFAAFLKRHSILVLLRRLYRRRRNRCAWDMHQKILRVSRVALQDRWVRYRHKWKA